MQLVGGEIKKNHTKNATRLRLGVAVGVVVERENRRVESSIQQ